MILSKPVDMLPQFKGLVQRGSDLMLHASSLVAKGEAFAAAVAWNEAGRAHMELADALVKEGYAYAAAQDYLNAVACFLEAKDYRPAEKCLQALRDQPAAAEAINQYTSLSTEKKELEARSRRQKAQYAHARDDAKQKMGKSAKAHKLPDSWIQLQLLEMPGVPEFHWFAALKAQHANVRTRAVEHLNWCVQLRPDNSDYWILLLTELYSQKKYDRMIETADLGLAHHQNNSIMIWYAGWARLYAVVCGQRPRRDLNDAKLLLERAMELPHVWYKQTFATICALFVCLTRLGQIKEARKLINRAILDYQAPWGDFANDLLAASGTRDEGKLLARIPEWISSAAA